jgi:redox-regulated HSP33 family molecular chaperone
MEEHGLRVFENRLLSRKCRCKRNAVRGKWRRWHTQELHDLYSSTNVV